MRAWHCAADYDEPEDGGHVLVFAPTAGRARALTLKDSPWEYEGFTAIKCRRAPQWDGMFDTQQVYDGLKPMPEGWPAFYSEVDA